MYAKSLQIPGIHGILEKTAGIRRNIIGKSGDEKGMEQLIMRWKNDGGVCEPLSLPAGVEIRHWSETAAPLDTWLDIVQYGLTEKKEDEAFWRECNYHYPCYQPEDCAFFLHNGQPVATITVICDPAKKEGYIHMVAAKPEARGLGIGNLMSLYAVQVCRERGMETAYLTTDDFRIPAIKTYLKGGFLPDTSTPEFAQRWEKIFAVLGGGRV